MSFFGFGKKKKETVIAAPVKGDVRPLKEVSDPAFCDGAMGPGFIVRPSEDTVVAPVDGTIAMTFPTKHALGITTESGAEILIHIGVDTVALDGEGFTCFVQKGDSVKKNQPLVQYDRALLEEKGVDDTVILVLTNASDFSQVTIDPDNKENAYMRLKK